MIGLLDRRGMIFLAAFALWAFAIVAIVGDIPGANTILRILLGAFAIVQTAAILKSPSRLLAVTPLYLLAISSLCLFSLGPAIYVEVTGVAPTDREQNKIASYVGSFGELLVLQFSALSFALTGILHIRLPAPSLDIEEPNRNWEIAGFAASAVVLGLALIVLVAVFTPWLSSIIIPGRGGPISEAIVATMAISIAVVARAAIGRRGRRMFVAIALIAVALVSTMVLQRGLVPLFIGLAPLGLLMLFVKPTLRSVVVGIVLVASLLSVMMVYIAFVRTPIFSAATLAPVPPSVQGFTTNVPSLLNKATKVIENKFVHKVFMRQAEIAWCLDQIAHGLQSKYDPARPFYFATAIVPRVLWPDKPSISLGANYAYNYCEMQEDQVHSQSMTILAEPIIRGGIVGLMVMHVFVGVSLMVITVVAFRRPEVGIVVLIGILPWLINFEQHFAMYFANSVKISLMMSPLVAGLIWLRARSRWRN